MSIYIAHCRVQVHL